MDSSQVPWGKQKHPTHQRKGFQTKKTHGIIKHVRVFIFPPLKLFLLKHPQFLLGNPTISTSPGWCSFSLYRDVGPESDLTTLGGGTWGVGWLPEVGGDDVEGDISPWIQGTRKRCFCWKRSLNFVCLHLKIFLRDPKFDFAQMFQGCFFLYVKTFNEWFVSPID